MNKNKDKGFTLVELLIVIVILGILATVTVFAVRGITDKGQQNACDVEGRTLDTAIESYYAQTQTDPATAAVLEGDYLKSLPDTAKWTFAAAGDAIPASNGPDGVVGGSDDRAAVAAGTTTTPSFYGVGVCDGY